MNLEIQAKIGKLHSLCMKHRVKRLDLFGSATGDDFDPAASDLDFLVEFEPMPPPEHADHFFDLLEDLKHLFKRHIDLLESEPIENPYLWRSIEQSRHVLYERPESMPL